MKLRFNRLGVLYLCAVACLIIPGVNQTLTAASPLKWPFVEKTIFEIGKHFVLSADPDFDAVGTASAGSVMIDTSHSKQKGWYAEELMYDHETIINGYQSSPTTTDMGENSLDHRYYPAKFEYYDMTVYERDPQTNQFTRSYTWVGSNWYEPDVYLNDSRYYVIWATTKSSDTKYRVFSNYQMQNGPDDRLRRAGTYTVRVKYKVYKLSYQKSQGMVFTPDNKPLHHDAHNVNSVAEDHQQVDILDDHEWIMEGPNAHGWIKRSWGKDYDVVAPTSQFATFPVGVPVGTSAVVVREVNKIEEEYGSLDE